MGNTMTQAELAKAYSKLGCKVTPKSWDSALGGSVVTTYGVSVSLSGTGSMVVRTVRCGDGVDPSAIVAEMRKELAARAKATRSAIRAENKAT